MVVLSIIEGRKLHVDIRNKVNICSISYEINTNVIGYDMCIEYKPGVRIQIQIDAACLKNMWRAT
jgi:hypothetical protein